MVRQNGRAVYDRMSADLDLASVISQLEELIMSFVVISSGTGGRAASIPVVTAQGSSLSTESSVESRQGTESASAGAVASASTPSTSTSQQPSSQIGKNLR